MTRSRFVSIAALLLAAGTLCVGSAHADIIVDEAVAGDLSGDRLAPNPFTLVEGDNQLIGILEGDDGMGGFDRDFFSLTVPAGLELASIFVDSFESVDMGAFLAIDSGPVFSVNPDDATPGDLMGWTVYGQANIDVDIMITMSGNGMGFSRPLPANTYSFWSQQTGERTEYTLNFVVVPAPSAAAGLALSGLLLAGRRRR